MIWEHDGTSLGHFFFKCLVILKLLYSHYFIHVFLLIVLGDGFKDSVFLSRSLSECPSFKSIFCALTSPAGSLDIQTPTHQIFGGFGCLGLGVLILAADLLSTKWVVEWPNPSTTMEFMTAADQWSPLQRVGCWLNEWWVLFILISPHLFTPVENFPKRSFLTNHKDTNNSWKIDLPTLCSCKNNLSFIKDRSVFFSWVEKNSRKRGHPGSKRFAWCATRRPSLGVLGGSACHFFGDLRGDGLPLWAEMWQKMEWWDDKVVVPVFMKHLRWCRISSKRCKKLGGGFIFFTSIQSSFSLTPPNLGILFKWRMEPQNDALEDDFPVELGDFFRFQLWPAQPSTHLRLWPTDRYLTLQCQQVGWLEAVFCLK